MNKKDQERIQKELDPFISEITEIAKEIAKDFKKNTTNVSSSTMLVNEDSPYLDEEYKGNEWKRVIKIVNKNKKLKYFF